jgi:diadenosine tetraphosphatase ApaH/serine/threonine PP2A family protein phosphatase
VLFVNCGSVGKPKDGDPRGCLAVLSEVDGELEVELPRIAYPVGEVAAEMRDRGLPAELAQRLRDAR